MTVRQSTIISGFSVHDGLKASAPLLSVKMCCFLEQQQNGTKQNPPAQLRVKLGRHWDTLYAPYLSCARESHCTRHYAQTQATHLWIIEPMVAYSG